MSEQNEMPLGGKLGPRVAKLLSDAHVYTRQKLGPHQAGVAQVVLQDFTNHVSDEIRGVLGDLFRTLADDPNTAEEIRPILKQLGTARGQAWAWIGGQIAGTALSTAIGDVITNYLNPTIRPIIAAAPAGVLSVDAVTRAAAHNVGAGMSDDALRREAAYNGIDSERFELMVELAKQFPSPTSLMDMVNRGIITPQVARDTLEREGFERGWADAMLKLAPSDFTLPEISALWNRSIIDTDQAVILGKRVGFNETQIKRSLELGGEPLPPTELGEAFRRGIIDRARFNRGIVQGPLRNEWFDVLEALQFSRMSTVDAADAVNQGHLPLEEGKRIAHENGLDPDDFQVLIETAGAPPGIDFATEALNRRIIDIPQFREMFLESRIKNRYIDLMLAMRTRLIPQETARLAYREGVYTREKLIDTLLQHGFTPDDAGTLAALEDSRQDETTKELTRAQIVQMYDEQILDAQTTLDLLRGLGFSEESVGLMMALADIKRIQRFINAAITRIRAAYLSGKIDEGEVVIQLDALQVPSSQREELLTIWGIDKQTVTKTLTASQIRQAVNKQLISHEDGVQRLVDQGYDQIDAALFLELTA